MKTIILKPELNAQLQELRKEIYKNTFIDYSSIPQIRTNIWDFEVSFSNYCYDKSHDYSDADIYRIDSVDVLLTKI